MKTRFPFLSTSIAAVLVTAPSIRAAILTGVPMGGSMVHVNFLYNAAQTRLEVRVDPVVPQLAPLDVTNPSDDFDPADPWFGCLSPAAGGLAFNRQFGFVMDAATDPLPANTGIWVRQCSCSPGVRTYRYRSTEPKAWEPILGTLGATNVLAWNLAMFHPAVTTDPTNGSCSAQFEAFAVDLNTGQALAGMASAPFTLTWSVVPSGRPLLELGPDLLLKWRSDATNYVLESCSSIPAAVWAAVTNTPSVQEGYCRLPLDSSGQARFYRLKRH